MNSEQFAHDTRARILEAAREAFSENGYDGASIRQIVTKAGANVASVNYHFGNKDALYEAVVKETISDMSSRLDDVVQSVKDIGDAEEKVLNFAKGRIKSGLGKRFLSLPKIVGWEILAPRINNVETQVDSGVMGPAKDIDDLLRPVVDGELDEQQWELARTWFMAITLPSPPVARRLHDMIDKNTTDEELDALVTPVARAAICGLKAFAINAG